MALCCLCLAACNIKEKEKKRKKVSSDFEVTETIAESFFVSPLTGSSLARGKAGVER